MTQNFENQKNIRAGSYTAAICASLLLIFFFVKWNVPEFPQPLIDEGMEVNLGSSDAGLGDDQPFEPGSPSPKEVQQYTPPQPVQEAPEAAKDVETDDREEDAPVVKAPPVAKQEATKIPEKEVAKTIPKKAEPAATPAPPAPKPKAVFRGATGTGTGGNEADSYKKGGSEGIAGGKGDQGKPGGDPNSKNYEGGGGSGKSGVTISRGLAGRTMRSLPSFEDDFNENAKVAVDIRVDESGKVTSAVYQPRGSTTGNANLKAIATRKAMQIRMNETGEESFGTIVFNFRLKN